MTERKIEIREMPNREYVEINLNFELKCDSGGPHFYRPIREEGDYWNRLDDETKEVVKGVMLVDGVSHITVYPYQLVIQKGRLFDFHDISTDLSNTLRTLFGAESEVLTSPIER